MCVYTVIRTRTLYLFTIVTYRTIRHQQKITEKHQSTVSKKQDTLLVSITSRNIDRFSKFFSLLDSAQNLLQNDHYIFRHILKTLLHYPVKP